MTTESLPARIESRADFEARVREALLALPEGEVREVRLVDVDFGDWPLGEAEVLAAITRWLQRPQRRLRLLGLQFDEVARRQPRFALWRRDWSHAIEVMRPEAVEPGDMPCLMLAGAWRLEVLDRLRWRGLVSQSPAEAVLATHRIDAISQRCEPAWPVDTLGL